MDNVFDRIVVKNDGIYYLVDYKKNNPREDIIDFIKLHNIRNVNYLQIENSINDRAELVLITEDTNAINISENMEVIIDDDNMMAKIQFSPPLKENGKLLTKKEILDKIYTLNIRYGVNLNCIDEFIKTRDYSKEYIFAQGLYPEKSTDGFLEFYVDINEKKIHPKEFEDGSVDHKNLNLFETVKKGDILVVQIDHIRGEYGKDIFGNEVPSEIPKSAPGLPKGKNTEISEDGKRLLASSNGCVFYKNKLIDVLPVLEINSDIDNSTGNIDFIGSVIIRGNVLSDFKVNAHGDIEIHGWVEGATIVSEEGSVYIARGVQGACKAKIVAGKNISVNFVENSTLVAEKDIDATSIMHCNIYCNGNVSVLGRRGLIVGGKAIVEGNVIANNVGSSMSNNTEITIGINYKVLQRYETLIKAIDSLTEKYSRLDKVVKKLSSMELEKLSNDKRILFEKSIKEKLEIKNSILKGKKELQKLLPMFTKNKSTLKVTKTLYGGTKIVANNAIIFIKEDIGECIVMNEDGKVKVFR